MFGRFYYISGMKKYLVFLSVVCFIFSCRTESSTSSTSSTSVDPTSLQLRLIAEPDALSPILARRSRSRTVFRHLYTRLLDVDPVSLEFVPYLATSRAKVAQLENGNRSFTFEIHKNASWSDGTPLTVNDILFSYKILKHPGVKTRYGIIADLINDIQIDTENQEQVTFIANECHITMESSIAELNIYPEHIFDPQKVLRDIPFADFKNKDKIDDLVKDNAPLNAVADRFMNPEYVRDPAKFVTAGPYLFSEWITGQRIQIKKNDNWWGNSVKGNLFVNRAKQITFQIIPDHNTALTQLVNGELDAMSDVVPSDFDEYKKKDNLQAISKPALSIVWLTLNTSKGLLKDKNVRKALSYVCNEESLIKNAKNGYGNIVTGPFMPGTKDYNTKIKPSGFQPEKAGKLLKASGWDDSNQDGILDKMINGKRTNLSLEFVHSPSSKLGPLMGELLKNDAKKVGIDIRITPKDSKIYGAELKAADFDIVLQGTAFPPGLYDPKGRWHTESFPPNGSNYSRFGNEKSDKLIDGIRTACDNPTERTRLAHELHAMIAEENPVIFLYNDQSLHLINKKYDNVVVSSNRPGLFEEFLTLK